LYLHPRLALWLLLLLTAFLAGRWS
jgi:hypothetical protein